MDNKRIVTLTLTNSCNLSCSYCYEANKSPKRMSFEIAKEIIDKEFNVRDGMGIEFDLFGGEPFLEFDLIKQICDYIVENYGNRRWLIFASTNGTLVHGEIQEWLKRRPYFYCGLSLDGNKLMHDINRSNSFASIDIDFFIKQYPKQGIKMTISQETLPYLFEGITFLHSLNVSINCNLAYAIDWSKQDNVEILSRELTKLIEFYLAHPEIKPARILDYSINQIGYNYGKKLKTVTCWCGAGRQMHTYAVDGKYYPCQFFMPLSVGEDKASKSLDIKFPDEILISLLDKKCWEGPLVSACPNCYGANYCVSDNIYKKDENYCKLMKIIFKAISYFKARQWEFGQLNINSEQEVILLRAIKAIHEMQN